MGKTKRAPELRFPGFTNDWEQRKLGEVFKERSERANGDEELLSVTIGNGVIRQADSDKRNTASEDKSNYKIVRKGDVPYNSMRMWQGAVGNSEYDGIVSPAYTVLIPTDEANGKFFMELFKKESTLQIFQRWSQGLTSDTWNLKYPALSTIQFYIPSVDEQNRIADYFSRLDNLITLHQRKRDALKTYKKAMLQKMFPKNGEAVPEIRFPGFTDDWEQRKLGDYVDIVSGDAPSKFEDGNELYVKVDDLNYNLKYVTDSQSKVAIHKSIKKALKGSVVFPKRGAAIMTNKVRILAEDSYMDTNMMALSSDRIDSEFLYNVISKEGLYKIADTSTIPQINNKHIEPYEVMLPNMEEQKRIGEFFEDMDNLIALHQRKLEQIREYKNGLLQRMFV